MTGRRALERQRRMLDRGMADALKEAGYPQAMEEGDACYLRAGGRIVVACRQIEGRNTIYACYSDGHEDRLHSGRDVWIKCPGLSELIAACEAIPGYHLFCLEHPQEGWLATMADDRSDTALEPYVSSGYRETPEKAVAALWLEMNASHRARRQGRSAPSSSLRRHADAV
jgi:hypothetical protein